MSATSAIARPLRSDSGSIAKHPAMPPRISAASITTAPAIVTGVETPIVGMLATWYLAIPRFFRSTMSAAERRSRIKGDVMHSEPAK